MADDLIVTPGTGKTMRAREKSGKLYQVVNLDFGTAGAEVLLDLGQELKAASLPVVIASDQELLIGAGTNNIGDVDILSIAAGLNLLGTVGCPSMGPSVTPVLDTAIYASGDLLFDATEVLGAARGNGLLTKLETIVIIDKANQKAAFTLLFANALTDFGALNAAPSPDDAGIATVVGHVPVATADYFDLGAGAVACIRNVGLKMKVGGATTSLYIAGVNGTGTPTYALGDLVIQMYFKQD
jgi:hypothetical protein